MPDSQTVLIKRVERAGNREKKKVFHSFNEVSRTYFPEAFKEEQKLAESHKKQKIEY